MVLLVAACEPGGGGANVSLESEGTAPPSTAPAGTSPTASSPTPAGTRPTAHFWPDDFNDASLDGECGEVVERWTREECDFLMLSGSLGELLTLINDHDVDLLAVGYDACRQLDGLAPEEAVTAATPPPELPGEWRHVFLPLAANASLTLCAEHRDVFGPAVVEVERAERDHWWSEDADEVFAEWDACGQTKTRLTDAECSYMGALLLGTHEAYGEIVERHSVDLVGTGYEVCATLDRHPAPAVAAMRLAPHPDWPDDVAPYFFHAAGQAAQTLCPDHADVGGILGNRFITSM